MDDQSPPLSQPQSKGTARRARERKLRAQARHVRWLTGLQQAELSHHTAVPSSGASVVAGLMGQVRELMAELSKLKATVAAHLVAQPHISAEIPHVPLSTSATEVQQPSIAELKALYKAEFGEDVNANDSDSDVGEQQGPPIHTTEVPFVPLAPLQPGLCPPDQGSVLLDRHDAEGKHDFGQVDGAHGQLGGRPGHLLRLEELRSQIKQLEDGMELAGASAEDHRRLADLLRKETDLEKLIDLEKLLKLLC